MTQQNNCLPFLANLVALLGVIPLVEAGGLGLDGSCRLLTLLPFSNQQNSRGPPPGKGAGKRELIRAGEERLQRWPQSVLDHFAYTYMAAAQMAIDHFNQRDSSIVSELAELSECSVTFPEQVVVDSGLTDTNAVMGILTGHHSLISQTGKQSKSQRQLWEQENENCSSLEEFSSNNLLPPWCAVLGPKDERGVIQTSALTGALDTPQMIFNPVGRIAYKDDVPTTVLVSLPDIGQAKAIVGYLQRPGLERDYLAILHYPTPTATFLVKEIMEWNEMTGGLQSVSRPFDLESREDSDSMKLYREAAQWLHGTGMKTILLALYEPEDIRKIAQALEEQNMLERDYVYMLLEDGVSLDRLEDVMGAQQPGSPLDKLLSGAVVISQIDRFRMGSVLQEEDPFERSWKMQNASFVQYLNGLVPKDDDTGEPLFQAQSTYFQDEKPAVMATFIYDSVIAVGIGACKYQQQIRAYNSRPPPQYQGQGGPPPNGTPANGQVPPNGMPPDGQWPPPNEQVQQNSQQSPTNYMQQTQQNEENPPDGVMPQQGQWQQGSMPQGSSPGERNLAISGRAAWGTSKLGILPTIDRLFANIDFALTAMQRRDNTTEFVSRVQVMYNATFGYPQRILIVYDIPTNTTDINPLNYTESTFFATVTNLEALQLGLEKGQPRPSIETPTAIATHSALEEGIEIFIAARSLWDSYGFINYQFDYDLFFDAFKSSGVNRQSTPYPWKVVVGDLRVKTVVDSKKDLLFSSGKTLAPSSYNSSSSFSVLNETSDSVSESTPEPTIPEPNETMTSAVPNQGVQIFNDTGVEPNEFNATSQLEPTYPPSDEGSMLTDDSQPAEDEVEEGSPIEIDEADHSTFTEELPDGGDAWRPEGMEPGQASSGQAKPSMIQSIQEASFGGASGSVSFLRKARDYNGIVVGAFNIRPLPTNQSTGLRTYTSVMTSYAMPTNSTELDAWNSLPNEAFLYRDGDTVAPTLLREIEHQNFLSNWVQIVGLVLFAIALLVAVASAIAIWYLGQDRIVRAGQPPFLYMLCMGSALMSGAIFTLSWDESYGWSDKQLDIACALTPWFFFLGHLLMFAALFTKMWRVDKVLQFSRRRVKIVQVVGPLVALLLAAVAVLSTWAAIDHWQWERRLIQEDPPETYGECTSEHFGAWFGTLAALMLLGKITTAAMIWKTKDIPQDFSDTSSVFYAMSTHIQAWFIGIPILLVLGNDSADATYFGRVLLIWIFAVSGVVLVILPKIVRAIRERLNPELNIRDRCRVSGFTPSDPRHSKATASGRPPSNENDSSNMGNGHPEGRLTTTGPRQSRVSASGRPHNNGMDSSNMDNSEQEFASSK